MDKVVNRAPSAYDLSNLLGGQGAEINARNLSDEFDEQIVVIEDDEGGATVEYGDEAPPPAAGHNDNLATTLPQEVLDKIKGKVMDGYEADKIGRQEWDTMYTKGLELLGLLLEERTEPFKGASGVVHPLLQEAVTQFQAGAYKELIPANGPVQTKILGKVTPDIDQAAVRVKDFMNYMIMYEMEEYESEYDQMLYYLGLAGSAFKKVYRDDDLNRPVSKFIMAQDLMVPYAATDLRTAQRVTHVVKMTRNDILKRQQSGFYDAKVELPLEATVTVKVDSKEKVDKIEGKESSGSQKDEPFTLLECHCYCAAEDYENDNAIEAPYIITVLEDKGEILSIRRNWKEGDPKQRKSEYFVHYKFSPGLGFYGFGLIHLLGNLSRSATANLRQLIDAGTFSNLPGGFKVKGIRTADDGDRIQPGEWRDLDVPGQNLKDSLMPLPYKEPSATLFQLLGFVVGSAEKFVGTQEISVGDGRQEMPVGTTIALLERGSKVMSAVHKRLHSALKCELKLLAALFAADVSTDYPYDVEGARPNVKAEDFSPRVDIVPVSDPNIFSMAQRVVLAQESLKMAMSLPEVHNLHEAFKRMYRALGIQQIDDILPPPKQPKPENPAQENGKVPLILTGGAEPLKAFPGQNHDAHMKAHIAFMKTSIVRAQPAIYATVLQHMYDHISIKSEEEAREQLSMPELQMPTPEQPEDPMSQDPELQDLVADLVAKYTLEFSEAEKELTGAGVMDSDPLVQLKNRELDIKEQENIRKGLEDQRQLAFDKQKQNQDTLQDYQKIRSQEEIADDRIEQADRALRVRKEIAEKQARAQATRARASKSK